MRKTAFLILLAVVLIWPGSILAEGEQGVVWTGREWDGDIEAGNNDIVSIGREPARVDSIPYADLESAVTGTEEYRKELSPYYLLLSQIEWKFSYYENPFGFASFFAFVRTL